MEEQSAWEKFCKTGLIQDYINYTQLKKEELQCVNKRDTDDCKDRSINY